MLCSAQCAFRAIRVQSGVTQKRQPLLAPSAPGGLGHAPLAGRVGREACRAYRLRKVHSMNKSGKWDKSNGAAKTRFLPLIHDRIGDRVLIAVNFFQAGIGFGPIEEGIVREVGQQCTSI